MHASQRNKTLRIVLAVIFFMIALLWGFHIGQILNENPHYSIPFGIVYGAIALFKHPFEFTIYWNVSELTGIGVAFFIYVFILIILAVDAQRHDHYDRNAACGTARFETDYKGYNKEYSDPPGSTRNNGANNMILSQNVKLNLDGKVTMKNNNVCVVGGSGSGKSRFFVKPNILEANCNYVITDPAGDILKSTASFLESKGYEIKVFNLVEMAKSDCYNPFDYIRDDLGVVMMIKCLIKNTTPAGQKAGDPFWEKSEEALLQALCFYLVHHRPKKYRNFTTVMQLLRAAEIDEKNPSYKSALDKMFDDVEKVDPNSIALKQYKTFKMGAGKTLKSILISCSVRLTVFNLRQIENLTGRDTIELSKMGEGKKALFVVIPSADSTYNFLVSMMYSQLFETLYFMGETEYGGRLPSRVRFLLDEFANIGEIPEFTKKLATMRKYEISCSIILQNLAQIKNMYKDDWQTILGNCDSFVFLGGQEYDTVEYISKELGDSTIVVRDRGMSNGRSSSASQNYKTTSRKLLNPDEIMRLGKGKCIVLINGLYPFKDVKYEYTKHPNYKYTGDAKPKFKYINKKDNRVFVTVEAINIEEEKAKANAYAQNETSSTPKNRIIGDIKNIEGLAKTLDIASAKDAENRITAVDPVPAEVSLKERDVSEILNELKQHNEMDNTLAQDRKDVAEILDELKQDSKIHSVIAEKENSDMKNEAMQETLIADKNIEQKNDGTNEREKISYSHFPSEKTQMRNSRITTGTPIIANDSEKELWDFDATF